MDHLSSESTDILCASNMYIKVLQNFRLNLLQVQLCRRNILNASVHPIGCDKCHISHERKMRVKFKAHKS